VQEKNEDYLGLLRKLLLRKPKLNETRKDGQTIIFDVILYDNINLLKLLLNNGADPNIKDENLNTPFALLVEHGVKIETQKEREIFIEKLVFLLKFRIDINAIDINGRTIFHKAVIANDVTVVERLLSKRADLDIKDKQGRTALHHTQWKGNAKIARLLIVAGANMNEPDYAGFTVLNYAAILGHRDLVIQLINSGVLMYNHNKKSKKVAIFFKEKFHNLDTLLTSDITDPKLKDSLTQVIANLKNEVLKVLNE
jgi:ankyrin repeat protein